MHRLLPSSTPVCAWSITFIYDTVYCATGHLFALKKQGLGWSMQLVKQLTNRGSQGPFAGEMQILMIWAHEKVRRRKFLPFVVIIYLTYTLGTAYSNSSKIIALLTGVIDYLGRYIYRLELRLSIGYFQYLSCLPLLTLLFSAAVPASKWTEPILALTVGLKLLKLPSSSNSIRVKSFNLLFSWLFSLKTTANSAIAFYTKVLPDAFWLELFCLFWFLSSNFSPLLLSVHLTYSSVHHDIVPSLTSRLSSFSS